MAPRLVVFDLDGTLLRGPSVCEVLAARLGRSREMAAFEALVERDEVRAGREEMLRWHGDTPIHELCSWLDGATLAPGAIEGCARLRAAGCALAIASITWRFAVDHFADLIGAEYRLGTSVLADGQWDHVWPETKGEWVVELMAKLGLDPDDVAAVGDGRLDVPMLQIVGVPVFVGATAIAGLPEHTLVLHDADLRAVADYILRPAVDR